MNSNGVIRAMTVKDADSVLRIYAMGIETRLATFETQVPKWQVWDIKHLKYSRLVYLEEDTVIGWAALSPVSSREVYKGVAEASIYIDTNYLGKRIGSLLMEQLVDSSEINGVWTLQSSVFSENVATLKLHEKFGFRVVGKRERIAQLDGLWKDTVLLERRSNKVAI